MNKGLKALIRIEDLLNRLYETDVINDDHTHDTNIIGKALKRLEELEKAFDALSKDDEKTKKLLSKEIEKNRAFEIIKEMFLNGTNVTKVLLSIYQSKDFEEFQQTHLFANKDKYDLLKEVLSNGQ